MADAIRKYNYEIVKTWLENHVHKTYNIGSDEFNIMLEILTQHPNYEMWTNKNVEAFKITRSKKNKALQTHIKIGKKWRIVSWVTCANGKVYRQPNKNNQISQAMRYAIRIQINNWRKKVGNAYNPKCELCESSYNLEVDHYPLTFASLRDNFIEENIKCNEIEYVWNNKHTTFKFKKNEPMKTKWQRYHLKHATFRWLCGDCNKKMNRKCMK